MRAMTPLTPIVDPSNGERLKARMKAEGMTVDRLAEVTGLSRRTVLRLRAGRSGNMATWRAVAKALRCSIDEIAG